MDALQFAFWLNGFFEINGPTALTEQQSKIIQDHLQLVLTKVTPDRQDKPRDQMEELKKSLEKHFKEKQELPLFPKLPGLIPFDPKDLLITC